jgi:copper transport protein
MIAGLRAGVIQLALALLVLLGCPAAAMAHAVLLSASPAADAVLAEAPDHIELNFNEPVQVLGLSILDAAGQDRSPAAAPRVQDGRVQWDLRERLADGRYLVSWRVASLDGHLISGTFTFGVGAAAAPNAPAGAPAATGVANSHWPLLVLHAGARLLLLLAIGTALFRALLPVPDLASFLHGATRRLGIGAILLLVSFMAAEGAMRAGLPVTAAFSPDALHAAVAASNFGLRALAIAGLTLIAFGGGRVLQVLGIAGAAAAMADSGHVLAVLPAGVGHGLMVLHGLAAAMWIGAIAPLRRALAGNAAGTALLFRRFQGYGALAMGATLASGITLTCLLLPRVADLWQSDYGLRLCAKLAAVAAMLIIAATNRLWLTRTALAGSGRLRPVLRMVLGLDLLVAILATLLAVGLTLGPPPEAQLRVAIAGEAYGGSLTLSPGRIGDNDLVIALAAQAGSPAEPKEVEVRLTAPGLGAIIRQAERIAPGTYRVRSLPLWLAGPWQIRVSVLIDDFTQREISAEPLTLH